LPQGYVQNESQELAWRAAVGKRELPIVRGVALTDDDRFRGEIIERLMCDFEVDLAALEQSLRIVADLTSQSPAFSTLVV
jgi:oxygen-independent coproporphyrinogen-3 oxidase